jgi:hypothetical protein
MDEALLMPSREGQHDPSRARRVTAPRPFLASSIPDGDESGGRLWAKVPERTGGPCLIGELRGFRSLQMAAREFGGGRGRSLATRVSHVE